MFLSHYSGRAESTKYILKPSFPVRWELVDFQVYTIFTKIGSRSTGKHIQLCRFFAWIPGKVENGEPRMLCFAGVFLVFWSTLPAFRSRMGPGPENLNPVRTPGCRFRCFSWKIASRNHQYSLGFNWYFACGDDGKLDSKSTKILLVLCRVFAIFRRVQEK